MARQIARLIGGAGTGKTTELLRIMGQCIETGLEPHQIGFVSFTRAARAEAAGRASEKFGCRQEELERDGWFRTLHSVCYRCLGAGDELLVEDKKGKAWISEALNAEIEFGDADAEDDMGIVGAMPKTDAAAALAIWAAARSRLSPYEPVWREIAARSDTVPPLARCRAWIEKYELHKAIDHRRDFTDLLGQFAGWRFGLDGHERCRPEGDPPEIPVWFFDEQQDTSVLLDSVCHRLIDTEACQWVYVVGDPFQAIYGFAGADSRCFRAWPADKERTMPKSHRCPRPMHVLGETILRGCSDYWDRKIEPAGHAGDIDTAASIDELLELVCPTQSWLLLARTNFQARRFAAILNKNGIPWRPTKGHGGWHAPKRTMAIAALCQLQSGFPLLAAEWAAIMSYMPSRYCSEDLLTRGTKTRWAAEGFAPEQEMATLGDLAPWGATPRLREMIGQGTWTCLIDNGQMQATAIRKWGSEVVENSGIRVGTVHSVKGSEADNVAVLTTTSEPIARGCDTQSGADEERRVAYVAVTRARRKLIVLNEPRERNRMEIEV